MPQGETHHLRQPCQGREQGRRCFFLTVDGVEDENEMPALGLDTLLEHPGQLKAQLCQTLASCGEAMEAEGAGNFSDGCLEEMSPGDTLNRVDNGVLQCGRVAWMTGGFGVSKPPEQSLSDCTLPSCSDAVNNTVRTWCRAWLLGGQYGSQGRAETCAKTHRYQGR